MFLRLIIPLLIILPYSLCVFSQENPNSNVTISGIYENSISNEKIFLCEIDINGIVLKDSSILNVDNKFNFNFHLVDESFFLIKTSQNEAIKLLIKPGEDIRIHADGSNLIKSYTVEGSAGSELIRQLEVTLYDLTLKVNVLLQKSNAQEITNIYADSVFKLLITSHRLYLEQFIHDNTFSLSAINAIHQRMGQLLFFNMDKDTDFFEQLGRKLLSAHPNNKHCRSFFTSIMSFINEKRRLEILEERTGIGKIAPDIILLDKDSVPHKLSDLSGKLVLLKFWNPNCDRCRSENKELITLYNLYKNQGFEIFAVSIGTFREEWLQVLTEDSTDLWQNVKIPEEGVNIPNMASHFVALYGIEFIPYSFLINKDGKIINKGFSIEELNNILKDFFKEP
ncbi:MAG: thioredoxin-like domain-containing protein [Bacteroidales bacterium]|nr:thioredoxin-like domain-containing protein [Bacteroidales bacterium]